MPVPALLFKTLTDHDDQLPEVLGVLALKFAHDLDQENGSRDKKMTKAFHYLVQHYWAMANRKLATFNLVAFTSLAASAFADEMHTRYINAPKAAP